MKLYRIKKSNIDKKGRGLYETQDIFYNNENVLFISTHQYPYYPGSGSENERGKFNNIKNIPLPAGTGSEEYLNAFEHALKKLEEFKP